MILCSDHFSYFWVQRFVILGSILTNGLIIFHLVFFRYFVGSPTSPGTRFFRVREYSGKIIDMSEFDLFLQVFVREIEQYLRKKRSWRKTMIKQYVAPRAKKLDQSQFILFNYSSVNLLGTRLLGTNGIFEKNLLWTF